MKKGFTLVELLAVIIVIAVIALIAIPIIINVMESAKKGAIKDSAYGIIEAANVYVASNLKEGLKSDIKFTCSKNKCVSGDGEINFKGRIENGTLIIDTEERVLVCVDDGEYYALKDLTEKKVKSGKGTCGEYEKENGQFAIISSQKIKELEDKIKELEEKIKKEEEKIKKEEEKEQLAMGTIAEPVIKGSLVPITIENDGTVKKVDTSTEWYNYKEKKWANAVILKDENVTYNNDEIIPENNIESYFVWIPRYRYRLWNTGTASKTAHSIEIVFETKDTAPSTGSNNGEWLTHPAFTTLDVNGFWVGKFETGYDGATNKDTSGVNSNDSDKIIVKPNVYSWHGINIENIFTSCYNYKRSNDDDNLDSHMMKNTEWGAVAYLSHSKYGIDREVNINNNSNYKTGYSALPSTNQLTFPNSSDYGDSASYNQPYNTEIGYLASTTGNITGVYDMSGGVGEYVASYCRISYSSFDPKNYDDKYFDFYLCDTTGTSYEYRMLGDATGEMGPIINVKDNNGTARANNSWYNDSSGFVGWQSYVWFVRGGYFGDSYLAGQFSCGSFGPSGNGYFGFRLVLSPQ